MENKGQDIAQNLQDINRLVHEPSRLLILAILNAVESADFLYLLRETQLTKGNLSSHLAKLEEGGLVEIEKSFQGKIPLTICRLTMQGRSAFEIYRKQMQTFFNQTSG